MTRFLAILPILGISSLLLLGAAPVLADGGVTFTDVGATSGVTYLRTPSPDRLAIRIAILNRPTFIPNPEFQTVTLPNYPMKAHGSPGVALLDYDRDGDLDIYVTNGPGTPNSLYSSQLVETGSLTFVDVAAAAGVEATSQDSSAVCFGDIDNDGDPDLYVTATGNPYQLFRNEGDGTFTDITDSVTAGQSRHSVGCTMADVDNDGLLDIVVGNSWNDWKHRRFSFNAPTIPGLEHNFLFLNQGGGTFADVSAAAGLENVSNMSGPGLTGAGQTWAIGTFDYDQDGNIDILSADNQGAAAQNPSQRRGWLRLFENDGNGYFTDSTQALGLVRDGGWMGVTFGDYDCDSNLDLFATNIGDYLGGGPVLRSVFYFGNGTGFTLAGPFQANAFGWGTSSFDYDNDGDLDVVYHGGLDRLDFVGADNPGVLLQNQGVCSGTFLMDLTPFSVDHARRNVHGVATGDLNDDGFPDVVSVSAFDLPVVNRYFPFGPLGGPLDGVASFQTVMGQFAPGWAFLVNWPSIPPGGSLSVEINNAENGNNWVKVRTRGSVDTLANGTVNRDGIGAVVKFTPKDGGPAVTRPIVGGSSYASQDSLEIGFGLGSGEKGNLEILWPGGVRNSLRGVKAGETVLLPEIPCSFDGDLDYQDYHACVTDALDVLIGAQVLPVNSRGSFLSSAIDAYHEFH